jgi:3-methyladenine DNA glycosylase Tag
MKALPANYLLRHAESIRTCGKLTSSEANALALFRMAERFHTYCRTLEQIAVSGSNNAELAVQARNALRDEPASPAPPKRLVRIAAIMPCRRPV